eukprot:Lithocolla_globosa_v1_NODE_9925_length_654_cov_164.742905.p1 type:complete len:174 gc:universal NODE_9925_length_654_cov_164.742905:577-56(-)
MGANQSAIDEMVEKTGFNEKELSQLMARFKKLDTDQSGALSPKEFLQLTQVQNNPLAKRVIEIFDEDGGGDIDFQEFIKGLSIFSNKSDKTEKLRFAFKVYDLDGDGFISNGELFQVLKTMVGDNLKEEQLQQIVDKSILEADKNGDGKIDFQEFCDVVESGDFVHQFSVSIL